MKESNIEKSKIKEEKRAQLRKLFKEKLQINNLNDLNMCINTFNFGLFGCVPVDNKNINTNKSEFSIDDRGMSMLSSDQAGKIN